jgi:hypothetical protein
MSFFLLLLAIARVRAKSQTGKNVETIKSRYRRDSYAPPNMEVDHFKSGIFASLRKKATYYRFKALEHLGNSKNRSQLVEQARGARRVSGLFSSAECASGSELRLLRSETVRERIRDSASLGGDMKRRWPDKLRQLGADVAEATKNAKLIAIEIVLFASFVYLLIKSLIVRLH